MTLEVKEERVAIDWWALSAACQQELVVKFMAVAVDYAYAFAFYSLPILGHDKEVSMRRSMPVFFFSAGDLQTATASEWRRFGRNQEAFVFSPFLLKEQKGREFYDFPFQFLKPSVSWDSHRGLLRLYPNSDSQLDKDKTLFVMLRAIIEKTVALHSAGISGGTQMQSPTSLHDVNEHLDREDRDQSEPDRSKHALTSFKPSNPLKDLYIADLPPTSRFSSEKRFCAGVSTIVKEIGINKLKKVVLSRAEYSEFTQDMEIATVIARVFIETLRLPQHIETMVALFSSPSAGTWFTVSPELLVSQTQDIFRTVSLAGTQLCQQSNYAKPDLAGVLWSDKDIQEQVMVSRYIVDCFKILRLRSYEETGPETVQRGNLLHLETKFTVDTKKIYGNELVLDMLTLLHPTSAVAGDPFDRALNLLRVLEPHDRGYYSGFLGPLHLQGETVIYVNLRCAELMRTGIIAYAGTGIVKQSVPHLEWKESTYKLHVIKNLFKHALKTI
ncbi:hypothetical protein COTS27_00637 [Spirochaetota bacterium]|nr:hypothetical protein COTS27_00637 [Spirochaetota bacterium]